MEFPHLILEEQVFPQLLLPIGVSTVNIVGGGSGTGLSTTGINTGFIFSNPNSIDSSSTSQIPDHNYLMFGPVALNATVNVGVGNTFTIV